MTSPVSHSYPSISPLDLHQLLQLLDQVQHLEVIPRAIPMVKYAQNLWSGWWFEPLWKIWKSIGMIIPNIWENKKCSKPPTRLSHLMWSKNFMVCVSSDVMNDIIEYGELHTDRTAKNQPQLTTPKSAILFLDYSCNQPCMNYIQKKTCRLMIAEGARQDGKRERKTWWLVQGLYYPLYIHTYIYIYIYIGDDS